jgi:hypothetical protein
MLDAPAPVLRYFRFALTPGAGPIREARLKQRGVMRGGAGEAWKPFTARETIRAVPIEFMWDASMRLFPFVVANIHDEYVHGEGASEAKIARLISLGRSARTPKVTSASLLRYLAEAAWFPTVLFAEGHISWLPLDDRSARATLRDGATEVMADFAFGEAGEIVSVSAMRYRDVKGVPLLTPWRGRYRDYAAMQGMMIPMGADVEWIIDGIAVTVWRADITGAAYDFNPGG